MDTERLIDDRRITTFGHLIEAHARLTHVLDEELRAAVGIPLLWYGVLLHIGRSPGECRPMGELVNATAFTSGGVTRLVDRMERAGYVARRPCATDRRVMYVGLTDRGRDALERGNEVHVRGLQRHMIARLDQDEVKMLDAVLARLAEGDGERPARLDHGSADDDGGHDDGQDQSQNEEVEG